MYEDSLLYSVACRVIWLKENGWQIENDWSGYLVSWQLLAVDPFYKRC
ncbi:MAG: hypothetical protein ACRCY5_06515 [Phocaeicola sp.]